MPSEERSELRGCTLEGGYLVGACIGVGGTGVVFEGTRLRDGHPVVVKTLRPIFAYNSDLCRRLRREKEVYETVRHPSLVPVLDEGSLEDGSPFIVMERIYGEPLTRLLRRRGTLAVEETLAIMIRVCDVLHRAHAHGYIHRDVKPEHIIIDRTARGALKLWLLDFGVCAATTAPSGERERERGRVFGTPSYVSPEQASGNPDVDPRADVFGLGVVVFEALAGKLPYHGSTITALLRRIIREEAPRLALASHAVSRELDLVVGRMLARDRDERYPTARAVARALSPFCPERKAVERRLAARARVGSSLPDTMPTLQQTAA